MTSQISKTCSLSNRIEMSMSLNLERNPFVGVDVATKAVL